MKRQNYNKIPFNYVGEGGTNYIFLICKVPGPGPAGRRCTAYVPVIGFV